MVVTEGRGGGDRCWGGGGGGGGFFGIIGGGGGGGEGGSESKSRRFRDKNAIFLIISESTWGARSRFPLLIPSIPPLLAGANAGFALSGAKNPTL